MILIFSLLVSAAEAAPPTWTGETVSWHYSDVANVMSLVVTTAMKSEMPAPIEDANFVLMDADGRMVVELSMRADALAKLQALPPGQQTADLKKLREELIRTLTATSVGGKSGGLFGTVKPLPSDGFDKLSAWMRGSGVQEIIVNIGFVKNGTAHLYATIDAEKVTFDPEAPSAR